MLLEYSMTYGNEGFGGNVKSPAIRTIRRVRFRTTKCLCGCYWYPLDPILSALCPDFSPAHEKYNNSFMQDATSNQ